MAKTYFLVFSSGNPTLSTGLAPTFVQFWNGAAGSSAAPPAISEVSSGSGLYKFTYGPTNAIAFVVDGATTSLVSRYISGSLDPVDAIDEQLTAVGSTLLAGQSALAGGITSSFLGLSSVLASIGSTSSSFGSTAVDPGTIFGYLKRALEFNEGNSVFNKTTNLWDIYTRGSSTLLIEKTLSDASGTVTKT